VAGYSPPMKRWSCSKASGRVISRTVALDVSLADGMSNEGNRRAQDRRRREIMKIK
jgi:hypothetical protein